MRAAVANCTNTKVLGEGAVRRGGYGALVVFLFAIAASNSSWGTYNQFAFGLTFVTLPILIGGALALFGLAVSFRVSEIARADYYVFVVYAIAFLSFSWSLQPLVWAINFYWYTICIFAYFSIRFYVLTISRVRLIGYGTLVGALIGGSLVTEQINEWGLSFERQSIAGVNANLTAYVFASTFYLIVVLNYLKVWPMWIRYVSPILLGYIGYKIISLGTRGAVLSCAMVLLWTVAYSLPIKKILVRVSYALVVFVLLYSFGFADELIEQIAGIFSGGGGAYDRGEDLLAGRLNTWTYARQYIQDNPLLGIGVGSFSFKNPEHSGAHNFFLAIWLDVGLFGFIAILLLLHNILKPAIGAASNRESQYLCGAFLFHWLPIAGSGYIELSPFTWLFFGLTYNMLRFSYSKGRGVCE